MKKFAAVFLALIGWFPLHAQDDGCGKCEMLREECEVSTGTHKDEICAFFKQECLQTDTVFVSDQGKATAPAAASAYQVVESGTCIKYKQVREFEKKTKKEVRTFQVSKNDTVYVAAETPSEFKGGDEALIKFLNKNVRYPAAAREKGDQGTVYVKCIVRKDGKVESPKAIRGPSTELKAEAVRVITEMPAWNPATFRKQPVSMYMVIPVRFTLR